jgi:hypothetical protein
MDIEMKAFRASAFFWTQPSPAVLDHGGRRIQADGPCLNFLMAVHGPAKGA